MTVLLSSRTNESELLFTVISNATLQPISTAFALRRQVKLQKTSGNRDAHPSPRTALWALVLVIHSKRKYSVVILTLKIVFDTQIYYENRIKILRLKLIKGFWKIIQISLWIKKKPNKNASEARKRASFYFCDSKAQKSSEPYHKDTVVAAESLAGQLPPQQLHSPLGKWAVVSQLPSQGPSPIPSYSSNIWKHIYVLLLITGFEAVLPLHPCSLFPHYSLKQSSKQVRKQGNCQRQMHTALLHFQVIINNWRSKALPLSPL